MSGDKKKNDIDRLVKNECTHHIYVFEIQECRWWHQYGYSADE